MNAFRRYYNRRLIADQAEADATDKIYLVTTQVADRMGPAPAKPPCDEDVAKMRAPLEEFLITRRAEATALAAALTAHVSAPVTLLLIWLLYWVEFRAAVPLVPSGSFEAPDRVVYALLAAAGIIAVTHATGDAAREYVRRPRTKARTRATVWWLAYVGMVVVVASVRLLELGGLDAADGSQWSEVGFALFLTALPAWIADERLARLRPALPLWRQNVGARRDVRSAERKLSKIISQNRAAQRTYDEYFGDAAWLFQVYESAFRSNPEAGRLVENRDQTWRAFIELVTREASA